MHKNYLAQITALEKQRQVTVSKPFPSLYEVKISGSKDNHHLKLIVRKRRRDSKQDWVVKYFPGKDIQTHTGTGEGFPIEPGLIFIPLKFPQIST